MQHPQDRYHSGDMCTTAPNESKRAANVTQNNLLAILYLKNERQVMEHTVSFSLEKLTV